MRHDFLGTEIRLAYQAMEHAFARRAGRTLAPTHGTLLLLIEESANLTQQQLSEAIGLQRSTVARTLDAFERQGLVRRHARPDDRRSYAIRLTGKGTRLARRLRPVIFGLEKSLRSGLGPKRSAQLMGLLRSAQDLLWAIPTNAH